MASEGLTARYGLDPREARELVDELVRDHRMPRRTRLALVAGGPASTVAALGRAVELSVFGAEFGNSAEELAREYGPYEATSTFFVVVDARAGRPAGVMRMISAGPAGLKSVNDLHGPLGITPEEFLAREGLESLDGCLDIATLAVHPAYRGWLHGYRVSLLSYRALFLTTRNGQRDRLIAIMDKRALGSLHALGVPFRSVAGTTGFSYLGSPHSCVITIRPEEATTALGRRAAELRARGGVSPRTLLRPSRLLRRRLTLAAVDDLVDGRGTDHVIHLLPLNDRTSV